MFHSGQKKGFTPLEESKNKLLSGQDKNKRRKFLTGFTIIELLVVIAVIGILATIVLVVLNNSRKKARDAVRWSDMEQISKAMMLYYDSASPNFYPDLPPNSQPIPNNDNRLAPYLNPVPVDPGGSTYRWKDKIAGASNNCFCVWVELESEPGNFILANQDSIRKTNKDPVSANPHMDCCTGQGF